MNQGDGVLFFDSGKITMYDDLNTNNYRLVGRDGGGSEIEDRRLNMHEEIDLNAHGLRETLSYTWAPNPPCVEYIGQNLFSQRCGFSKWQFLRK